MSIHLVTGPPGAGKSYFCVRHAMAALEAGKWLATNVELHEGWEHELARSNVFRRPFRRRRERIAREYRSRTWVTHSLDELTKLRLPPCGKCPACRRDLRCMREGRGIMLLDEAHNWLNARTWDSDETGQSLTKTQAVQNRLKIVRFFSQHRKLGWTVYLVSQDAAQLDVQVRRNFEYHVHLRNFRTFKVAGIRPCPFHLFSAVTTWFDAEQSKVGAQVYTLNRRLARLYDTTATSHGLDWDDPDAIWLGRDTQGDVAKRRPATEADVIAEVGLLPAGVKLTLRCPSCSWAVPFDGAGAQAPTATDRPTGIVHMRCPSCGRSSALRRPGPELVPSRVVLPSGFPSW